MNISEEITNKINEEFASFEAKQYAGKDKKERQRLGQFFTPPVLSIEMLKKFESIKDKTILDPTCGAGGLLAAAVIAGADPNKVYGIELDPEILKIAQIRLAKHGVPPTHLKLGNALEDESYEFTSEEVPNAFIVLSKFNSDILVLIVKNKKLIKEIVFDNKDKLKELLIKLTRKNIKIFKV